MFRQSLLCVAVFLTGIRPSVAQPIGDAKAGGLRKLTGRHITIHTDLAPAAEVDELPQVFDLAVPQWCRYFGVELAKAADWKMIGCVMLTKERFVAAGLYPADLPPFPHGYARGSQLWVYDQPSSYYRRHLLLHEGTHQFMERFLGGNGPPWYSEGMAKLLGTHQWKDGKLTLGIVPRSKEEVPYWGRVKVIKDGFAAGKPLSLADVMGYDSRAHIHTEAYAWSWAATMFFDQHPLSQAAFRELQANTRIRGGAFSRQFQQRLAVEWPAISEDWQLFVAECDYGYDVARAATMRKTAASLPRDGASVTVAADRGWQSTGYRLEQGKTYHLVGSGRYQVAIETKPWISEAGGVTIRYYRGEPLGKLLAAVGDLEGERPAVSPLIAPKPIGLAGEITPERTGTLYLKVNEAAGALADNTGTLRVQIKE